MKKILRAIVLPGDITPFERDYLRRTNRLALAFFALHIPLFTLVALVSGTSPWQALALSSAILAGPALGHFTLKNPRTVSLLYGVTAMAMGALLVHLGQGPVQIEMHFYFFALIAMLALFGNPMVIVAAAATVALHHLALWFLLPASVFNYDAPIWVVAVHAAFVVLESIGACYIARSFFDNVIGLESAVRARTEELSASQRDMRLVLDHVDEGFVSIDRSAIMANERSASLERWFGAAPREATLFDAFAQKSPEFAALSRLAWEEVENGWMPIELTLDQMPRTLDVEGRSLAVRYRPIGNEESPARFLVVVTDETAARASERAEADRLETRSMFERMFADRSAFLEFFEEATTLVSLIVSGSASDDLPALRRAIHTLKGNAAVFGLGRVSAMCHDIEGFMDDQRSLPPASALEVLGTRWAQLMADVARIQGDGRPVIQLAETERAAIESAIREEAPRDRLLRMVRDLKLEPTSRRLETIADQARRIAERLGKDLDVSTHGNDLRLDASRWTAFWGAFVHAVRNAVDHGIEARGERPAGKAERGHLALKTELRGDELAVEIIDDGCGIDWSRVAAVAAQRGLPNGTTEELVSALFSEGLSTAREVSDVSGRGVGMGALREAVRAHGGRVAVVSSPGAGTTITCLFPASAAAPCTDETPARSLAA